MCRKPLGSGGKRVTTASYFPLARSSATSARMKSTPGARPAPVCSDSVPADILPLSFAVVADNSNRPTTRRATVHTIATTRRSAVLSRCRRFVGVRCSVARHDGHVGDRELHQVMHLAAQLH